MATSGSKIFLTGAEEVAQNIETRLRWFFGEAFLEPEGGTPWFQSILGKAREQDRESALKNVIVNTRNVSKLTSFKLEIEGREIQVSGSVLTPFGASEAQFTVQV